MYEYVGNIHIHSHYSDGSGSINQIAEAAQQVGLDFIIVTDHFTLAGKKEEGYHHGVLVLVGMEINAECNHYLALNIDEEVPNHDHHPQAVIDQVREQGGLLYAPGGKRFTAVQARSNLSLDGLECNRFYRSEMETSTNGETGLPVLKGTKTNPGESPPGSVRPYPEVLNSGMHAEEASGGGYPGSVHAVTVKLGLTRLVIDTTA